MKLQKMTYEPLFGDPAPMSNFQYRVPQIVLQFSFTILSTSELYSETTKILSNYLKSEATGSLAPIQRAVDDGIPGVNVEC